MQFPCDVLLHRFQGAWVLPALRQLINISKNIIKASFQKADKVSAFLGSFLYPSFYLSKFYM